ncbi:MAG TPA: hypothetical protein VKR31_05540 [Rhizomicrobium sp.]|nr:hypothetical protein [Rhizomicrobium sp.]
MRAQLRAQQARNREATSGDQFARVELRSSPDRFSHRQESDPDAERRRNQALAILARQDQRVAVVAEAGNPAHVTVAIRGVAVGELEVPGERYDAFALLALMQQYGHA